MIAIFEFRSIILCFVPISQIGILANIDSRTQQFRTVDLVNYPTRPVPKHGMAMVPRGEVELIFAEFRSISGIFSNEVYAGMVIGVAYTTLFSPFWIKLYYRLYGDKFAAAEPETGRPGDGDELTIRQ